MRKVLLITVLISTLMCSCVKGQKSPQTIGELVNAVTTIVDDTTCTIDKLDEVLPMLLDSMEEIVQISPDANDRYDVRLFASVLVDRIGNVRSSDELFSFMVKYQQQLQRIVYSWYVEDMPDNDDGTHAFIISHAAPTDGGGRMGFTFAVGSVPVLMISLPADAISHNPVILFESQDGENVKSSQTYSPVTKNLTVMGDDDSGLMLLLDGEEWVNDLLNHECICIAYFNKHTYDYSSIADALDSGECVNLERIFLFDLQEKYQSKLNEQK